MLTPELIATINATAAAITEAGATPTRASCDLDGSLDYYIGADVDGYDGHLAVYVNADGSTRVAVWPVTGGESHNVPTIADAVRALREGAVSPVSVADVPF